MQIYRINQPVRPRLSTQGLERDHVYRVSAYDAPSMDNERLVRYTLRDAKGEVHPVVDGNTLLVAVE
jgi:hypothetical protein